MTRRERLRRCYFNEELDRPAVNSWTGFPDGDPSYDLLRADLAQRTELKTQWAAGRLEASPPIERQVEPYSEAFERCIRILRTPKGELRQTSLRSLQGQPGLQETSFVGSAEDAQAYLSLPIPGIAGDVSSFFENDRAVGDAGIAEVYLGMNPAGFVADLCGSETFAMMSVTDRDALHALCERRMTILLRLVAYCVAVGLGPYFAMIGEEYVVPPLHGPADFQDFNVRYDKPIIDRIHEAGGRVHVHSHGSIRQVFRGFLDMGADVLHPFEGPPQGDILAREAKALARGRMCLEGNIQIHRMYEATPEEIRAETEQLIADAFDDHRGLIVCPTASPYIRGEGERCFPQYKSMIDAVLQFRA